MFLKALSSDLLTNLDSIGLRVGLLLTRCLVAYEYVDVLHVVGDWRLEHVHVVLEGHDVDVLQSLSGASGAIRL